MTSFYLTEGYDPYRAYHFLTEAEMDRFVENCVTHILEVLQ